MLQQLHNDDGMLKSLVSHLLSEPLSPVSLDDLESILLGNQQIDDSIGPTQFVSETHTSASVSCISQPGCDVIIEVIPDADVVMLSPSILSVESIAYLADTDTDAVMLDDDVGVTFGDGYLQREILPMIPLSRTGSFCGSMCSTDASGDYPSNRREKKKHQNKAAARTYRQKKRAEKGTVFSEVEQLEQRNTELKDRVTDLNREISYLKGLMEEICQP
jgi:hypothetical protein